MGCGRWEGKGRDGSCDETWGDWMGRRVDTHMGPIGREMDGRRWDQTGRHKRGLGCHCSPGKGPGIRSIRT